MSTADILFQPFSLGRQIIDGRVCKTATSETRASEKGFVTDALLAFYEPIVRAGTPLIITGNLFVSQEGKSTYRMCGADAPDKVPGLKRWADLAHSGGSRLFGQINHCGRQVFAAAMGLDRAVSASNVTEKVMGTRPRPLTVTEIKQTVQQYAASAQYCREAGFDGIQIHAGHGYLINQFLSPYTNRRNDDYGGDFHRRLRFFLEVYRAVRERVGQDCPLIAKIGGDDALTARAGLNTAELVEIARILQEEGLDGVEITVGHYESGFPMIRGSFNNFFKGLMEEGIGRQLSFVRKTGVTLFRHPIAFVFNRIWPHYEGFNTGYSRRFKETLSIPVICVGGFLTRTAAADAINRGWCDAVSIGRAMIADPYLYRHFRQNRPGPECSFCNGCIARAGRMPVDCYDPEVKEQQERMLAEEPPVE